MNTEERLDFSQTRFKLLDVVAEILDREVACPSSDSEAHEQLAVLAGAITENDDLKVLRLALLAAGNIISCKEQCPNKQLALDLVHWAESWRQECGHASVSPFEIKR